MGKRKPDAGGEEESARLRLERLLPFVLTMYADRLPRKKRTRGIIRMLDTLREIMGEDGGTVPYTILYPLAAAREAERMGRMDGLTPDEMLGALDWLLKDLPEEERPRTRRALLEHFRLTLEREGYPVSEWILIGQERYGRWGDGPGEIPGEPPGPGEA
ncbi:MAG TPA: hypothetical protein VGR37_11775 [Longimicrobiaceae bacterium]|nr:hypothetical protein [Longimicrobiaceae bacterium]